MSPFVMGNLAEVLLSWMRRQATCRSRRRRRICRAQTPLRQLQRRSRRTPPLIPTCSCRSQSCSRRGRWVTSLPQQTARTVAARCGAPPHGRALSNFVSCWSLMCSGDGQLLARNNTVVRTPELHRNCTLQVRRPPCSPTASERSNPTSPARSTPGKRKVCSVLATVLAAAFACKICTAFVLRRMSATTCHCQLRSEGVPAARGRAGAPGAATGPLCSGGAGDRGGSAAGRRAAPWLTPCALGSPSARCLAPPPCCVWDMAVTGGLLGCPM